MRFPVRRKTNIHVGLVGQELKPATIERHLCLSMAGCNVGIAVIAQLRYGQFVPGAHVVTSLLTLTLPLRIAVTLPVALIISRS